MAAASATVAVEVGATACACESPCTTRQGGFKSERGMRTALDGMEGSASSMGAQTNFDDHAEEEEPGGKTPRGIEPLGASNIVRGWDTSQGLGCWSAALPRCSVNGNAAAASTHRATRARNAHHMNPRRTMRQDGASTVHCGASKLWRTIGNLGAN